jgi:type VI secretion system secreted protein VgrG
MAKATQEGRILSIKTNLGEDYLLLNKLAVNENISQLYKIDVELLFDEDTNTDVNKPTVIDLNAILGQPATMSIAQGDGTVRYFNGIFESIRFSGRTGNFSYYHATIVPQIWELTQIVQSRIFQQKSVKDILSEVFEGYNLSQRLQRNYKLRNYCVQYNETDFDFVSRLMEEEGISYYFEFSSSAETLVMVDNFQTPQDCPVKSDIPIFNENLTDNVFESAIKTWSITHLLRAGKVTLWDHHFQLPKKKLETTRPSSFNFGDNRNMEIYNFPAGYARKYDGIDKSGGEQSSDLQNIFEDNAATVKNRIDAIDCQQNISSGVSNCASLTAGHRFNLKNHPNDEYNMAYILLSVTHEVEQFPFYMSQAEEQVDYTNTFTCIPHGTGFTEFRPSLKTPKPIIHGSQTAVVVGSGEIFTDKYGRVKVQFHWDRYGNVDSSSSCWVRVAQTWAGNKWGGIFIPRVGMEVIVHFLEGNPDLPIITGCVYNADAMPPYTLPDEKTKSTLKTNSSEGGLGFNEFRIEDKKGSEQIFVHGEKDLDIRIKNDAKEIIKRDRHLIIERNQMEKVNGDKHLKVMGNHNEKIDTAYSLEAGTNIQEKAGQKIALDAGQEVHIKAGMTATIEAGTMLTLKVGGNFVNINSAGVFIKGTMVMINSGGAAGSGSGCSPTAPTAPTEADTANPGDRVATMTAPPPTTPRTRSPKSVAMQTAAQNGTPFVAN